MVSLFKKKRSSSIPGPGPVSRVDIERRHSSSSIPVEEPGAIGGIIPESEIANDYESTPFATDEYALSPTSSLPLSENDTLNESRSQRIELQHTYVENFDHYLPFLLRRLRLSEARLRAQDRANDPRRRRFQPDPIVEEAVDPIDPVDDGDIDDYDDDLPTILNEPIGEVITQPRDSIIMGKNLSNYNLKREFVIASEFIKHNVYVFPSEPSFQRFKDLRSRKNRKNSTSVDPDSEGGTPKTHIIPLDYKKQGVGLPLFRISVPYMSSFRKSTPLVIFHKYLETPLPPSFYEKGNVTNEEEYESYKFCVVHAKRFQMLRRYRFEFTLTNGEKRVVLAFQHNFKPFTDFKYENTRFRILGTSIVSAAALTYNPSLKLLVVDQTKPSLCDDLINKKPGFELSSIIKKSKQKPIEDEEIKKLKPEDYPNPYPDPSNELLKDDFQIFTSYGYELTRDYIPNNLPPFGTFKDAITYDESLNLLPKKYTEVGRVELYQDNKQNLIGNRPRRNTTDQDVNSTKSVDIDNLILSCILLTFREVAIRTTARPTNTSILASRVGARVTSSGDINTLFISNVH